MYTVRRLIHQHALTSAIALVLALLLSVGWGQVHRVLHPGALSLASAEVGAKASVGALAHEDGSSLCQLLDHLTHSAGPAAVWALPLAVKPPALAPFALAPGQAAAAARNFDARGPPRLT